MQTNPDAPRGPSTKLTEQFLLKLGIACIWVDEMFVRDDVARLAVRTIAGRRAKGEKIWFRSQREAERVMEAIFSRCQRASRHRDGLTIKRCNTTREVSNLVMTTAKSLGLTPILDAHVAATFDSINRRIEAAIARMQRDGSMKKINREYSDLRQKAAGTSGTSGRDIDGTNVTSLPSYQTWLVERLGTELSNCTELVHITRL